MDRYVPDLLVAAQEALTGLDQEALSHITAGALYLRSSLAENGITVTGDTVKAWMLGVGYATNAQPEDERTGRRAMSALWGAALIEILKATN